MKTRQETLDFGLSFPDTYVAAPFRDPNWQLVRIRGSKKAFLWTYERDGYINLNVKPDPAWRDFWRDAYSSVIPGWHQNKEHWNTIILDGSIPDEDIRKMITESYDVVTYLEVNTVEKKINDCTDNNFWLCDFSFRSLLGWGD